MESLSIIAAFMGGLVMFLAPCTLPLVPTYLAFLAGGAGKSRMLVRAGAFLAGFSILIVLAGFFAGTLGRFFAAHREVLIAIGGLMFIVAGLFSMGVVRIASGGRGLPAFFVPHSARGAFVLGAAFSFAWSPCLGPILGGIYTYAASRGAGVEAVFLLGAYVLGYALPFFLLAVFYERAERTVVTLSRFAPAISKASGVLLVAFGVLMISGQFGIVSDSLNAAVGSGWRNWIWDYL